MPDCGRDQGQARLWRERLAGGAIALSGNAQGGIVAWSLALAPEVGARGNHALIAETMHKPLRQRMALLKDAGETARHFHTFMQEDEARAIMQRYGFVLPGETM